MEKLTEPAKAAVLQANELVISSISVWEIAIKIKSKKLELPFTENSLLEWLHQVDNLRIVPVDEKIWVESVKLDWVHRDPADRVIVSLAQQLQCPIVTRDQFICNYYPDTIW